MVSITASALNTLSRPARAISAQAAALTAPMTLRLTQGTSTRPPTGSQMRPMTLARAKATAWSTWTGVPSSSSTRPPAAMAEAEPISAWQPPSAPDRVASFSMTMPIPPAVKQARSRASSLRPRASATVNSTAGSTPQAPAVGAATTRPMQAFTSATARAPAIIREKAGPSREVSSPSHWPMRSAPPRTRPLRECWGVASPRAMDWRMTWIRPTMSARTAASGWPEACTSWRRNSSPRGSPAAWASARWASSVPARGGRSVRVASVRSTSFIVDLRSPAVG